MNGYNSGRDRAELSRLCAVRKSQWRSRFGLVERTLLVRRAELRAIPQNEALRAEVDVLEKMYTDLLDEGNFHDKEERKDTEENGYPAGNLAV